MSPQFTFTSGTTKCNTIIGKQNKFEKTTFGNIYYPHNSQSFKYDVKTFQYLMRKKARQHLKIKYFTQTQRFVGKASCSGRLHSTSEAQVTTHICSNKIFPKKIVKFENVNSFLKNVSAEKKRTIDFGLLIYCANYHPSDAST